MGIFTIALLGVSTRKIAEAGIQFPIPAESLPSDLEPSSRIGQMMESCMSQKDQICLGRMVGLCRLELQTSTVSGWNSTAMLLILHGIGPLSRARNGKGSAYRSVVAKGSHPVPCSAPDVVDSALGVNYCH